jgi:phage baseplate assembly protein V
MREITAGACFKVGVVAACDAANARVRVRFPDLDNLTSHWLAVGVAKSLNDRYYHLPDVGEQVACLMDARFEEGVVICAIYSDADKPPVASGDKTHVRFSDGTTVEYDRAAHTLAIDAKGPINIVAAGAVTVTAPSATVTADSITLDATQTTCTGKLAVQGLLTYSAGLSGSGGGSASAQITGNVQVQGNLNATGHITGA